MNLIYAEAVLSPENDIETRLREAIRSDMAMWPVERSQLLLTYGTWLRRRKTSPRVTRLPARSTRQLRTTRCPAMGRTRP